MPKKHLNPSPTKRRIKIEDNKEAVVVGEVTQVPVTIGPFISQNVCLIVYETP